MTDNGLAALAAALRAILSDFDREPDDEYMAVAVPMFLSLLPNGYTKDIARELDLVQRLARSEHTIATLRAANAEADSIIEKHIIRLARYFWRNGGHIETFANEARAALATAKEAGG
jgi:hypothetical protein